MLSTLVLLKYNNYYARRLKKETTLQGYLQHQVLQLPNVNFNPSDGVDTVHVMNQPTDSSNYLLVLDEANNITSRWFILEAKRTLKGQYTMQLHRDLWADYTEEILTATTFVEKGIAKSSDTTVFNDEQVTFNQIKKGEVLLKDHTQCQWLVGYYARKKSDNEIVTLSGTAVNTGDQIIGTRVAGIATWEYYKYTTQAFLGTPTTILYDLGNFAHFNSSTAEKRLYVTNDAPGAVDTYTYTLSSTVGTSIDFRVVNTKTIDAEAQDIVASFKTKTAQLHAGSKTFRDWHTADEISSFLNVNNSYILDTTTNKVYQISVDTRYDVPFQDAVASTSSFGQTIRNAIPTVGGVDTYYVSLRTTTYKLKLTEVPNKSATYNITAGRLFTADAPYDIFAIPYSDDFKFTGNGTTITCSKDIAMAVATDIATDISSGTVYDVQLLPYCPFDTSMYDAGTYTSSNTKEYSWILSDTTKVGVIFNISNSQRTFNIPYEYNVANIKMSNATEFVRLVSPNYNGQFEFTPAKSNGIAYFNVDLTYKPYTPYIHLNPNFGRLYGADYNDARGLICSGDFSIPVISDAWRTYQVNNKNYQNIFDRQIENIEVNNKYAQIGDIANALGGTVAGAGAGAMIGGVGGAVVGGVASLGAGIADIAVNQALRKETLDYTKDLFEMNMGNIKALPNGLTKVSSFNYNNKGFPFVELYDADETEKVAFALKLQYNGMTINRIGTLSYYLGTWDYSIVLIQSPYIKGKLIRFNTDVDGDTHLWDAIAAEMDKGVYYELSN